MRLENLTRSVFLMFAILIVSTTMLGHPMWGIAVDKAGGVYFSDLTTVWRIDNGGSLSIFRPKGDGHVHELTIDEKGNILGAENTYDPTTKKFFSGIWKMTPAGLSSYIVPLQETPPKGTSIWRDAGGNSYYISEFPVGNLLVLKRTANGEVAPLFGGEGAARDFRQTVPYGLSPIAFGTSGELYFTQGSNVKMVSREGRLSIVAGNIPKEGGIGKGTTTLFGIAIDGAGNLIVADYGNRRVIRIAAVDKQITALLLADGPWYPTGVATSGGDIYVLEVGQTRNHEPVGTRVRKMSADGIVTVLATVDAESAAKTAMKEAAAEPERAVLSTEEQVNASPAANINYLVIAFGAFLGAALLAGIWKGKRKLNFWKAQNDL